MNARLHDLNPENPTNLRPSTTMKNKIVVQKTWPDEGNSQKEKLMIFGCSPPASMLLSHFDVTMQLYADN